MGGMLSGILGGGSSPGQQQQQQALQASRADIQAYRPEAMQARLNALANATSSYQGANNALETLWGAPEEKGPPSLSIGGVRPMPKRMMGHDLPQQGPAPQQPSQGYGGPSLIDPLGIFGGR